MKAFGIAGCLGSILLFLAAAFAESAPPFSLTITVPQPEVKAGSGVKVDVNLTNNSDRVATLQFSGSLCDYASVEVRDGDGNVVPDTEIESKLDCAHRDTNEFRIERLKPGEFMRETIWVSTFSDMSQPGQSLCK